MRKQKGIALVLVLWVSVLIAVLLGSFSLSARVEALQGRNLLDSTRARYAAEAGLHRAAYELRGNNPDGNASRRSRSVRIPTSFPFCTTGSWLMRCCTASLRAWAIVSSGLTVTRVRASSGRTGCMRVLSESVEGWQIRGVGAQRRAAAQPNRRSAYAIAAASTSLAPMLTQIEV